MTYDDVLAARIEERLEPQGAVTKKMFGALTFLFQGNTVVNLYDEGLMVRVGAEGMDDALARPETRPFFVRGKRQTGWVVVDEEALDDDVLDGWLATAMAVTATLPAK